MTSDPKPLTVSRIVVYLATALAFACLLAVLVIQTTAAVHGMASWPTLLLAALLGALATDLTSGVVHWFCDTFFEEDTPLLGPALIYPFREHHRDPLAITRRSWLEVNHTNCLAMLVTLAIAMRLGGTRSPFGGTFLISYACAVVLTNQCHKWAHAPCVPRAVEWLQRLHLIISPTHHARHHCHRVARTFCVTTGWLNPLLDGLDAFGRLERRLAFLSLRPLAREELAHDDVRPGGTRVTL